ncbi:hypothetical protein BJF83_09435 [Nocardiopsis sp. CNR-923]|uniref:hypothetical protein n=1 Tax=Nocardiopsis sp. CNR-923 TaxID=1904965 RepID=UPI000961FB0F|nr:hypothetical protein [Nocardiopsis sp. CNR-923]OLT29926.1 hypothetical protein BJF83_09435 [Nocardiopsis sp. CNR-923]
MSTTRHFEIHALVQSFEDAFSAHDPAALAEHFAVDSLWTNALGRQVRGSAVYVFARGDEGWRIVVGQNTVTAA